MLHTATIPAQPVEHVADWYDHLADEAFARQREATTYADRAFFGQIGHNYREVASAAAAASCGGPVPLVIDGRAA